MVGNKALFQGLEAEVRACATCGSCRSACPVYSEIGWESAAPRGKITMAKRILVDRQKGVLSEQYVKRVFQCTLCGGCAVVCPVQIDTRELLRGLRRYLEKRGRNPRVFDELSARIRQNRNISGQANEGRLDWAEDLEEPVGIVSTGAPGFQDDPWETSRVGYFVGCVASFYPMVADIPVSTVSVLQQAGIGVVVLGAEEWCCGFPLLAAGRDEEVLPGMEHNLAKIRELGLKTLVTGCPSCRDTFNYHYPRVLGKPLGFEVWHITEYFSHLVSSGRLDLSGVQEVDEVVTYHDPCDLGRRSGIYEAPRKVLEGIPEVTLVEMEDNREHALCCGGGGNLQVTEPQLAERIAEGRVDEALKTGATVLATACQQCVQVLSEAARRKKARIRVMDMSQLLWEGLGEAVPGGR